MRSPLFLFLLFLIGSLSSRTVLAQVVAPSQGGEVGLVLVTATTMELTFGTTGSGQGRVIAMAPTSGGMPVPLIFTDNTFYVANTGYGQGSSLGPGYVVYNGPQHSTTVTGLSPNTYYYIVSAEYNTDGTAIAYNTRGTSISTKTRAALSNVAPLPVELTSFTGIVDSQARATLYWSTATENNTAYFALERSTDGVVFTEASRVSAAGISTHALSYQWPDPQMLTQNTYYRLRQADQDGTTRYSPVITLTPPFRVSQTVDVYPNPSTGTNLNLLLDGYDKETLTLRLTDAIGQLVMAQTMKPLLTHYSTSLPLPANLAAGTYLLTIGGSIRPIQKRITIAN